MSDSDTLDTLDKVAQRQQRSKQVAADEPIPVSDEEGKSVFSESSPDEALDLLLSAEPAEQVANIVLEPRKGTDKDFPLTLKSLGEKEWNALREEATPPAPRAERRARRSQNVEPEMDAFLFARLIIRNATTNMEWGNDKLLAHCGVHTGEDVVKKMLLFGEVQNVAGIVTELSGFDEDLVQFAQD
ncbi:unnamed protein product [marine sediment metagenome]|uniref:Uncharacterized protein n=1 Tax=marine sediment metagenome TaxID=412755 RepID=X0V747_9ZZZZ